MATVLEIFKEKEKEFGVVEALKFLDKFIQEVPEITIDLENEILDFGDYFVDNFDEQTEKERFEVWGIEDALILQLYDTIAEQLEVESEFFEDCENILTSIDRPMIKEMEKLYDAIVFYPGVKEIFCEFGDKYHFSCQLEEELNNEQIFQLKSILAKGVKDDGCILVDLVDKKIATAFLITEHEVKTIVPRYIKKLHNIDLETGEKLPKHKGYKYIEANKLTEIISREK